MVFPKAVFLAKDEENKFPDLQELLFVLVDGHYGFYRNDMVLGRTEETSSIAADFDYFHNVFGTNDSYVNQQDEEDTQEDEKNEGGSGSASENSFYDGDGSGQDTSAEASEESLEELVLAENKKAANGEFVKQETPVVTLDYEKMTDFTYLKQHFYTVDKTTNVTSDLLDARKFLSYSTHLKQDNSKPQILIYHTHSQEGFSDSVAGDASTTIVGVGERLAQILREEYGFNVIHDTGTYDVANRDYAYSVSAPALERILQENPSIEVIIDLHRDGVSNGTHLVKDVGGRPTAQFMFFNGISYLNATGPIEYLENPYIEQNLAFSFQLKIAADTYYPGFSRNIYLKGLRYNLHYREKSVLIEVGAQTNTVEEAMNAADPIAHILALVLNGE